MENSEDVSSLKQTFLELQKHAKDANEKLRVYLNGLSLPDMKTKIIALNLSDKSLNFLCEGIALEHEDYEICAAVEQIKKERTLTALTNSKPADVA